MTELEWKTRKERIDKKLRAITPSWDIIPYRDGLDVTALDHHAVTEFQTANGPDDYALFVKGKLLGIIEAKKVSVGPQNVLEQAKRYSRGAFNGPGNWNGYRVPFLYSTNGEVVHFLDVRNEKNISRQISGFHTADALDEFSGRVSGYQWFQANTNAIDKLRYYQKDAIAATESAVAAGKRAMLVAMATVLVEQTFL